LCHPRERGLGGTLGYLFAVRSGVGSGAGARLGASSTQPPAAVNRAPDSQAGIAKKVLPSVVTVRRIGEPVQVDHEALSLLTVAGLLPGRRVRIRREAGRVIVVRDGAEDAAGVSLPESTAAHVFAAAG